MDLSKVNWREQRRWWSNGRRALHVLEHLHHPLLICQAGLSLRLINQRLHVHAHFIPRVSRNYQPHEYVLPLKAYTRGGGGGGGCFW
jgi:hypothetical protein